MKRIEKKDLLLILLTLIATVAVYLPLLTSESIANKDNYLVEDPRKITSVSSYFELIKSGNILDIQPVRDISYLIDYQFEPLLGGKIHITFNILYWLLCLFFIHLIFKSINQKTYYLIYILVLSHPLYVQTISWQSARKHLLSFLFILITIRQLQKITSGKKTLCTLSLFNTGYLFSILSQPITILFPLWAVLHYRINNKFKIKEVLKVFLPLLITAILIGAINIYYYSTIYKEVSGVSKFITDNTMGVHLLALGRYWSQIFIPLVYSSFYDPGSFLNLMGLLVLVTFSFISYKTIGSRKTLLNLSLFIIGILPVWLNMTQIFVNDTYLLLGSLGIWFTLLDKRFTELFLSKKSIVCISLIASVLLTRSALESRLFTNISGYYENSYQKEPACPNLVIYTKGLFYNKNYALGALHGEEMIKRKCIWHSKSTSTEDALLYVSILSFSENPDSYQERKNALVRYTESNNRFKLALATLLLKGGESERGMAILKSILQNPDDPEAQGLLDKNLFSDYIKGFCENNTHLICLDLKKLTENGSF